MRCCESCCAATARHFGPTRAAKDLARYHRKGLERRARLLLAGLARAGVAGCSILDVGSGVGIMTFELLKRGAATGVLADASPAYLAAARAEAARVGVADRIRFMPGDFVDTARDIDPADVVVLDRAVCCYAAWRPLLDAAAARCRRVLALTYPRDRPDVRLAVAWENLRRQWSRNEFRAFVHPPGELDGALRESGLRRISRAGTFSWIVDLYTR